MKKNSIALLITLMFCFAIISIAYAQGPTINLPPDQVTMIIAQYPSTNCYFDAALSEVSEGYDVTNGQYSAWCVDEDTNIYQNTYYYPMLYSSYDPANPYPDDDWDMVNYILNHKQGTSEDVQAAIYYFINHGDEPTTDAGKAMVDDAIANGEGFVPVTGELMAVVMWIGETKQTTFIEVSVPLHGVIPEYPIGPVLGLITFVAALGVFKYRGRLPEIFQFKHL